jgi:hypothetical protein
LASVRGEMEPNVVIPAVLAIRTDPEVSKIAEDTLADIYHQFPVQ